MIERNKGHQRVIVHLAAAWHAGMPSGEIRHEELGALVGVRLRVIFPAARNVEKVGVGRVAIQNIVNSRGEPLPPESTPTFM